MFSGDRYRIQGRLPLTGARYVVTNESGDKVLFVEHPILQRERELILYTDEQLLEPVLALVQRTQTDLGRIWDLFDARSSTMLGAIRGKPFSSLTGRHEIFDPEGRPAGTIARLGRFWVLGLFSRTPGYLLELGGVPVARFFKNAGRAFAQLEVEMSPARPRVDPRFAIACALAVHVSMRHGT
jgi:hypothetical protein